ncbi:hypothetical protein PCANC_04883 [Puccinia coronata f. sp. avenae]|uniref:Uncharacterized protein n=1 Tax=Puccinia coronata f. sp. avenae TaxID=200324 RepID=A0A2N5W2L3_9BASI|nr:hypothetical protein PCANC_04883 [Puccinia coronata f. sp. avenae]
MGAHLRNGKNISFEQQAAAAAREQQRAEQRRTRLPDAQLDAERASGSDDQFVVQGRDQQVPGSFPGQPAHGGPSNSPAATFGERGSAELPSASFSSGIRQSIPPSQGINQGSREEYSLSPARSSAFAELESSLPPLMGFEELDQLEPTSLEDHLLDPHRGVAPSEINSRATSIALASARSTPVPAPVDRQEFLVTRREAPPRPPSQTAQPLRTRGSATPMQNQLVLREMTEAPQPQDQVTTMSNILHGQWLYSSTPRRTGTST